MIFDVMHVFFTSHCTCQAPLELLRQLTDTGSLYDPLTLKPHTIRGVHLIAACQATGGGSFSMSERLLRHFNVIYMPQSSAATLGSLFGPNFGLCVYISIFFFFCD